MNNGRDYRVSAMAYALARLEYTEDVYRQAVADSFSLTHRAAPDEVAQARQLAAVQLPKASELLVEIGRTETRCRELLGQWYALRRALSPAEIDLAEGHAYKRYPRSEQARATLDTLDEAVRDERERCALLAEGAGMPGLAQVIRMDPRGGGQA